VTAPIPVLLYHGVDDDAPEALAPFVMRPQRFREHMELIARRGCTTLTVSALNDLLAGGGAVPADAVLVTFDDGLADFGRHAWPVLHDLGIAATLYVVSGCVDGQATWLARFGTPPPMLTWDELRRLDAEGCEIGAHSATHPELDTLPRPALAEEVRGSRTELALGLGHPVRSFAYPHGYHDRAVRDVAIEAGYDSACAVRNMLSSAADDRFARARVTIDASCGTDELGRILDGAGMPVAPHRQQLRTAGWRTYRRTRRRLASRA
jgi:peptidoglycan/xylan/chitin deacetylase (PgdA/CDA1 family)